MPHKKRVLLDKAANYEDIYRCSELNSYPEEGTFRGDVEVARIVSVILKVDKFWKYLLSKNESIWFPAFKELLLY